MISVIVPVYNASATLTRCIDSILQQTMPDWNLILIDDGSADESGTICDEYAASDVRIQVIHKANKGVGAARNSGLDVAKGEYVAFVDSDDYIEPEYLSHMLQHMDSDTDIVISYAKFHRASGLDVENYPSYSFDKSTMSRLFSEGDMWWHTGPWAKLFKKSIIDRLALRFPTDVYLGEDAVFFYSYLAECKTGFVASDTEYNYEEAMAGSLTKRLNSFEKERTAFLSVKAAADKLYEKLDADAQIKLHFGVADYQRRALNAAYYDKAIGRHSRLAFLKENDFHFYARRFCKDGLINRVKGFMLEEQLFCLYDSVRSFTR